MEIIYDARIRAHMDFSGEERQGKREKRISRASGFIDARLFIALM